MLLGSVIVVWKYVKKLSFAGILTYWILVHPSRICKYTPDPHRAESLSRFSSMWHLCGFSVFQRVESPFTPHFSAPIRGDRELRDPYRYHIWVRLRLSSCEPGFVPLSSSLSPFAVVIVIVIASGLYPYSRSQVIWPLCAGPKPLRWEVRDGCHCAGPAPFSAAPVYQWPNAHGQKPPSHPLRTTTHHPQPTAYHPVHHLVRPPAISLLWLREPPKERPANFYH